MFGVSSQVDDKFVDFLSELPHGSGINYDWNMWQSKRNYYFTNAFHVVDDMGGYRDVQDFSIVIPIEDFENGDYVTNWRLEFNNGRSYWAEKSALREYLEDTFSYTLHEISPLSDEQLKMNFDAKWNTPEQIAARKAQFQVN